MSNFCRQVPDRCGGYDSIDHKHTCFSWLKEKSGDYEEWKNTFPNMVFWFGGESDGSDSKKYVFAPKSYLVPGDDYNNDNRKKMCIGISSHYSSILGGTFMAHHDIFHDNDRKEVSWIESSCDFSTVRSDDGSDDTVEQKPKQDDLTNVTTKTKHKEPEPVSGLGKPKTGSNEDNTVTKNNNDDNKPKTEIVTADKKKMSHRTKEVQPVNEDYETKIMY